MWRAFEAYCFDVRVFLLGICLAACGGAVAETKSAPTENPPVRTAVRPAPHTKVTAIDPITALGSPDRFPQSFIVPGAASLELEGPTVQAPPAAKELQGVIVDEQPSWVRIAVHVDGVAFALWTERARLLGIVKSRVKLRSRTGEFYDPGIDEPFAELLPGARVRMLKRDGSQEQVRYLGAIELDGWMNVDQLVDRTTDVRANSGRVPTAFQTLTALPGTIIRTKPEWQGDMNQLGITANGYFLDSVKDIDDKWVEVAYEDGDIHVRGYVSSQDPPGRVHKPHEAETPPPKIAPNAQIAAGTCLYAKQGGDPIGFASAAKDVELSSGRSPGWYAVTIDSPWGMLTFLAHGTSEHDLEACGPPVPPHP